MFAFTIAVCAVASVYDLRLRIIPDWLTLPYLVLGLALSLARHGLFYTLVVFAVGFLLCELFFRANVFGGGDLKLFMGIALVDGVQFGFWVFFYSLIASLPLFAYYILKKKTWKVDVPYAVAIFAGLILAHCEVISNIFQ
ncbi:A24 family peptidase [Desulfoscipio geothermicus]|uniref:Flp pilus assembly protein, protease CpaA n=1 Tax=Desulfoscipio geothermicus DSM 3669 TaxID=1121426 RepID=A0A1I6E1Y1_9FIRM|nr:A24 family peptidase [Desulfoscipio geothermicus]SFR11750.1 Flp pilus assembly protein, protease CpaA [Desulfoscipio geothermicus DSM 3669]